MKNKIVQFIELGYLGKKVKSGFRGKLYNKDEEVYNKFENINEGCKNWNFKF